GEDSTMHLRDQAKQRYSFFHFLQSVIMENNDTKTNLFNSKIMKLKRLNQSGFEITFDRS
ncbi:hypothetical protein, partial [Vibrio injensis]|uniref:hypothetical protein n=1 Tax=Vibrio injensis TaxID=1307414 RepID=UPI001ABF2784